MENMMNIVGLNKKVVQVQLGSYNKSYDFWTDIKDIKVGDEVVCDTANGNVIGMVMNVDIIDSDKVNKWIVQRIDMEEHRARVARDYRAALLLKQMERRRQIISKHAVYVELAHADSEMKELVHQYEQATGIQLVIPFQSAAGRGEVKDAR